MKYNLELKLFIIFCCVSNAAPAADSTTVSTNQGRLGSPILKPFIKYIGQMEHTELKSDGNDTYGWFVIPAACPEVPPYSKTNPADYAKTFHEYVVISPYRKENELKGGSSSFCVTGLDHNTGSTQTVVRYNVSMVKGADSPYKNKSDYAIYYTLYCYPPGQTAPAYKYTDCSDTVLNDYVYSSNDTQLSGFIKAQGSHWLLCGTPTTGQCNFVIETSTCPPNYVARWTYAPYTINYSTHFIRGIRMSQQIQPGMYGTYNTMDGNGKTGYPISIPVASAVTDPVYDDYSIVINYTLYCVPK